MQTYDQRQLQKIIAAHGAWRRGEGGERANLSDANLRGANLMDANLTDADLRGANLEGADLEGANLRRANLRRANLWGANLEGANLEGADLTDANLTDADLRGADLWGANLEGADLPLRLILLGESVKGRRRWAWLGADGSLGYIRCGCRSFASLDEARERYLGDDYEGESANHRAEMEAALAYWAAMIAARGEMIRGGKP